MLYEGEKRLTPKKPFPPCFGSSSWETGMRSPPTEAGGTLWLGWVLAGRRCGGEVWRAARTGAVKDARGRGAARGAARRNAIVCWNGEGKSKCSPAFPPGHVSHLHSGVPTPLRTGRRYPDIATSHAYIHPPRLAKFPLSDTHAFHRLIITYLACGV